MWFGLAKLISPTSATDSRNAKLTNVTAKRTSLTFSTALMVQAVRQIPLVPYKPPLTPLMEHLYTVHRAFDGR